MNPYPLLLRAFGTTKDEVLALVRRRISTGPFRPLAPGEPADREIVVGVVPGAVAVWESPGYLTPPPSVLGVLFDDHLPSVRVEEEQFVVGAARPAFDEVIFEARLALDREKQRTIFDRFATGIAARVARAFPYAREDGQATLRCVRSEVVWPEHEQDSCCRLELGLELRVERATKPRIARGRIKLGEFDVLDSDDTFGSKWRNRRFAADDYDREFANFMKMRLLVAFHELQSRSPAELRSVSVKELFDRL